MSEKAVFVTSVQENEYDKLKQPEILFDFTRRIANENAIYMEERIRFAIRRPPRWIPRSVWYQIIKRLFVIQRRSNVR